MIEDFILFFTKKGEKVLDMFVGTGSTLVACDSTGRNGVGIELNDKYADTAQKRVSENQKIIIGDVAKKLKELIDNGEKF